MKLTVFRSGKGDCLLLSGSGGTHVLVDGGMSNAYRNHVRTSLGRLAEQGEELALVYVSHIDADHISGILEMMEDVLAWKRFDYQRGEENHSFPEPDFPRPPEVHALWHNAFSQAMDKNLGPIEDQLVQNARITSAYPLYPGEDQEEFRILGDHYRTLANSVRQGLELTRRAGLQLGIPHNPHTEGGLMSVEDVPDALELGGLKLTVIGPFQEELEDLREEWNQWLEDNQQVIEEIEREIQADLNRRPDLRVMDEGQRLASMLRMYTAALGDRDSVTPPNLASLMVLAEEEEHRILLTGDGHAEDILKGLEHRGKLDDCGRLHLDVIKVQHHGSKNNIDAAFCKRITAPHYVFCGNGDHHNPHLDVIRTLVETRSALPDGHPRAGEPYTLWFNCTSEAASTARRREHMKKVEDLAAELKEHHPGLSSRFVGEDSFEVPLGE